MGIVETELAAFSLEDGASCRVEYNATGIVHVHLGRFRLEFTPAEFESLVGLVGRAREELVEMKGLDDG